MRQGTGISASIGAVVSALATLSCCLPFGFAAAIGAAGAGVFVAKMRPWFLVLSVGMIAFGFWQQRRAKVCDVRGKAVGKVLLWTSVVFVAVLIFFPQEIAGFIADRLSGPAR